MKALHDTVIVLSDEPSETSDGGIYLTRDERELRQRGEIIATGPEVLSLLPGDRVLWRRGHGRRFERDGKTYLVLEESSIEATIMDE